VSALAPLRYELEVAVRLSIPDNTAFTALTALRLLGYPELERVQRETIYSLQLIDSGRPAEEIVAALTRAEVLFNPNKHELSYRLLNAPGGAPVVRERSALRPSSEARTQPEYEAVVSDNGDDCSRLVALLKDHFGIRELRSLSRAIAWTLYESGARASAERLSWACAQLLCNPHSQRVLIRQAPRRSAVGEPPPPAANESR